MKTADTTLHAMFSYQSLEERILVEHPLSKLRVLVDGILGLMECLVCQIALAHGAPRNSGEETSACEFDQVLFSIRSERQLVQHNVCKLLYGWIMSLSMGHLE